MMTTPENKPVEIKEQENQGSNSGGTRKTRPPEQGLKCPRCDSPNTKFCYYNNYSLTQPRHFCKTCRRYWTNGGALRNVPIGGGCRKNKKIKTSSSSRLSSDSRDSGSSASSDLSSLRFLTGFSSPSVDFQLGGLPYPARLQHHVPSTGGLFNNHNQFATFGDTMTATGSSGFQFHLDPPGSTNSLLGISFPFSSQSGTGFNGANAMNGHGGLTSSIESLSNLNQDLHWKLQQQRLAAMFGGGDNNINSHKESNVSVSLSPLINLENTNQAQKANPQPILFQNLEISKPAEIFPSGEPRNAETVTAPTAEWFFGNHSYSSLTPTTATTSGIGQDNDNANNNWTSGVLGWVDLQQP